MPSPFQARQRGQSGIEVTDLFPHIASCIDELCVIRSMYTDNPNHEPSLLMMNSGNMQPIRPSLGSWLTFGLGTENQNLPGFVVLCPGKPVVGPLIMEQQLPAWHLPGNSVRLKTVGKLRSAGPSVRTSSAATSAPAPASVAKIAVRAFGFMLFPLPVQATPGISARSPRGTKIWCTFIEIGRPAGKGIGTTRDDSVMLHEPAH